MYDRNEYRIKYVYVLTDFWKTEKYLAKKSASPDLSGFAYLIGLTKRIFRSFCAHKYVRKFCA